MGPAAATLCVDFHRCGDGGGGGGGGGGGAEAAVQSFGFQRATQRKS